MESQEPILLSDGYPRFIAESDIYDPAKYEPEASELDEPHVRHPAITRELLTDDAPTTATLCTVTGGTFSVEGYEFAITRGNYCYDGQFFPSTQDDSVPLAYIRSQLNVYDRSGQRIAEMHFKTSEPSDRELYETDDIALEVLMTTLAPIFWRIENDSVDQLELFKLADMAITASQNQSINFGYGNLLSRYENQLSAALSTEHVAAKADNVISVFNKP